MKVIDSQKVKSFRKHSGSFREVFMYHSISFELPLLLYHGSGHFTVLQ